MYINFNMETIMYEMDHIKINLFFFIEDLLNLDPRIFINNEITLICYPEYPDHVIVMKISLPLTF